jgi:hypothetical protein
MRMLSLEQSRLTETGCPPECFQMLNLLSSIWAERGCEQVVTEQGETSVGTYVLTLADLINLFIMAYKTGSLQESVRAHHR